VVSVAVFWADTYNYVSLAYDITLTVIDGEGKVLAQSRAQDEEQLGGSLWDPPSHAKKVVPKAYARILGALLADPQIKGALAAPLTPTIHGTVTDSSS
jgi:hypothetical protein